MTFGASHPLSLNIPGVRGLAPAPTLAKGNAP